MRGDDIREQLDNEAPDRFARRLRGLARPQKDGPVYHPPLAARAAVWLKNWWAGAFGRCRAFIEGRDAAIDNAAMTAHDMGRTDIRDAINKLVTRGQ